MRGLSRLAAFALACLAPLSLDGASPQPRRIVSTAPSITETLYALGLGPRVVGVTIYCRYPADAQSKPKIGTFLEPDFERILALRPDLVLVIKNPVQVAERLRKLGLQAEELDFDSVAKILSSTETIGRLTGTQAEAARLTAGLRAQMEAVKAESARTPRRSVLFLVGRSPGTLQGLVGIGPGTFVDELITLAGGRNVLSQAPIQYPKVSIEQILASDPDIILDMGDFAHLEGKVMENEAAVQSLWSSYGRLKAVRTHAIRQVDSDVFIHPGPRLGDAARRLRALIGAAGAR